LIDCTFNSHDEVLMHNSG